MSALLTTTMPNMGRTIEAFIDAGLRDDVKIMVGGAPVTQEFADDMGADGYGKDAMACVALASDLVGAGARCLSRIDPEAYQQRLDRICGDLRLDDGDGRRPLDAALPVQEPPRPLHGAASAAATSASRRCKGELRICGGDDKIDYRKAPGRRADPPGAARRLR